MSGTEPGGEHLCRRAKARTGRQCQPPRSVGIARIGEVWMIKDVERFRAELQARALGEPEFAIERKADLPRAESAQNVTAKAAVEPVGENRDSVALEPLPPALSQP